MKLSCTDSMLPGNNLTEKAEILKKFGFDGIAVFCEYKDWNEELLQELMRLENRTGVKPCEFVFLDHCYGHLMDQNTEIKQNAIQMYKEAVFVCNKIGAITEMEYEYKVQDPLPLFDPYKIMPEDEEKEFVRIVNQLGKEAKGEAYILIEPCNRYETKYLTRLEDCMSILQKSSESNIGLLADFFHMSIEENDIHQSIINTGKYIKHVHLGDSNRLAPGYGHTDWASALRALKEVEFDGYMNLECKIPARYDVELPKIVSYLNEIERHV